jgi:hypothetical protein
MGILEMVSLTGFTHNKSIGASRNTFKLQYRERKLNGTLWAAVVGNHEGNIGES